MTSSSALYQTNVGNRLADDPLDFTADHLFGCLNAGRDKAAEVLCNDRFYGSAMASGQSTSPD
jgi:hypothetical protein